MAYSRVLSHPLQPIPHAFAARFTTHAINASALPHALAALCNSPMDGLLEDIEVDATRLQDLGRAQQQSESVGGLRGMEVLP